MLENVNFYYVAIFTAGAYLAYTFFKPKEEEFADFNLKPMKTVSVAPVNDDEGDIVSRMKAKGRNILILYGSQTGTAEDFSANLAKDARKYENMKAMVVDPEEVEHEDFSRLKEIENSVVVFCIATYGEGDPTDNLQNMYDWLKGDDIEEDSFSDQLFAVFGLGNKTYEYYNQMGKYFDKRLEELGGKRLCQLGLGDDDDDIEGDFNAWKEEFWVSVCKTFGVGRVENQGIFRQFQLNPNADFGRCFTGEIVRYNSHKNQRAPFDAKNPFYAPVAVNRELHNGGDRSCMHIELDITGSKMRYEIGDHVAVYPTNDAVAVDFIGKRLGIDLDEMFALENVDEDSNKKYPFPCPTTYRTALSHYVDIHGVPRANLLAELIQYASGEAKTTLEKLSGNGGHDPVESKQFYQSWVVDARRTIYHILEDLPELTSVAIDHLLELLPRLQPRYYSICSSSKVHPNSVGICAILVDYKTLSGRTNKGVATGYLKNKLPSSSEDVPSPRVPIFIRRSQFKLPFRTSTPVIMVGPGTGFAPFRGFLQQREYQRSQNKEVGDTILFTGCRNRTVDYIYSEELEEFQKSGTLSALHCAFSRDGPEKVYVQHLLEQQKEKVWDIIKRSGHIYVCGDAKNMARDVNDVIVNIVSEYKQVPKSSAQDFVKSLRNKGRYQEDVWS